MKCLVYAPPSSLAEPHFGILLEDAVRLYKEGNEVTFVYCEGECINCIWNPHGDGLYCKMCRHCTKKWMKQLLPAGIRTMPLKKLDIRERVRNYQSVNEIKGIVYRDVYVGYGVMSNYTSITRDPEPDFSDAVTRTYFDFMLDKAFALTDVFYDLVDELKPDCISLYNGRLIEVRPLFDIALSRKIYLRNNECLGGPRTGDTYHKIIYENNLPHNIPYNTELLQKVWNKDNEPLEEKERKGRDFFERRRKGVPAGDRVYIGNQKKGLLPADWDDSKRNIVIFNSSEDEFSAVGREFDQYSVFASQLDGIQTILEKFPSEEYHFYLRVHPNLARVNFSYHLDLYELPKRFKNLTVIAAKDPCSTYDLLDAAEKVIVFGSTMGAEAVYWKKPVILLGGAFYYMLDICYTPRTVEDMCEMIAAKLEAKDSYPAIQYGYYLMNRELLTEPAKYIDYTMKPVKFFNMTLYVCAYCKVLGSKHIYKALRTFIAWLAGKRKKIKLPQSQFVDHSFKKG